MGRLRHESTDIQTEIRIGNKKYVRVKEGALIFSMGINTFRSLALEAGAVRRLKGITLYNVETIEEYIELVGKVDE